MSRKSRSVNSVDKKLEAVSSTMTADKDPLQNIDLDLMQALEQAYKEAVKDGFVGDQEAYQDSLSLGELKRLGAASGGLIKMSMMKS